MAQSSGPVRLLIAGGGYVGLYTALRVQRKLGRKVEITLVDPQPHMTYQPFLPEAAGGAIEPRHVVVPLRKLLKKCRVLTGHITGIEHSAKQVVMRTPTGEDETLDYDMIVVALGSISRILPIPGLAENGISVKTIGEAIYLRNHVLAMLDAASTTEDPELRRKLLTFVGIGGGYTGIEMLAELEDMARYATRYYSGIEPQDMKWYLVEATGRIMPEVSQRMGVYTADRLMERDIQVCLNTQVKDMRDGHVVLSDGTEFDANTILWSAGVKANPVVQQSDLPLDRRGRVRATANLQVEGLADAWTAGDCSAVPDLSKIEQDPSATCGPSAQHAVRQANQLGKNIIATINGGKPAAYKHNYAGSVASLGVFKGAAEIYGVKLKGYPAWVMHRAYHLSKMPTFNRKFRILMDWTLALLFRREVISMGQIQNPRQEFERAAAS